MNVREIPRSLSAAVAGSFEQERREVLDGIFEALCRHPSDPDEMAACALLVRHLNALPAPG
jgi:hypothetical protein